MKKKCSLRHFFISSKLALVCFNVFSVGKHMKRMWAEIAGKIAKRTAQKNCKRGKAQNLCKAKVGANRRSICESSDSVKIETTHQKLERWRSRRIGDICRKQIQDYAIRNSRTCRILLPLQYYLVSWKLRSRPLKGRGNKLKYPLRRGGDAGKSTWHTNDIRLKNLQPCNAVW